MAWDLYLAADGDLGVPWNARIKRTGLGGTSPQRRPPRHRRGNAGPPVTTCLDSTAGGRSPARAFSARRKVTVSRALGSPASRRSTAAVSSWGQHAVDVVLQQTVVEDLAHRRKASLDNPLRTCCSEAAKLRRPWWRAASPNATRELNTTLASSRSRTQNAIRSGCAAAASGRKA